MPADLYSPDNHHIGRMDRVNFINGTDVSLLSEEETGFIDTHVLNAFRHQLNAREIFPVRSRQNMVQINVEGWPQNAIGEINNGRTDLQSRGFVGIEPLLVGSTEVIITLDTFIANTQITYRQALLQNGLLSGIYEVSSDEDNGTPCAVLMIDSAVNDLTIPVINQEFLLNWREIGNATYQGFTKTEKFSEEVNETAWNLLEEYMTREQYLAFTEGEKIELQNKDKDHRLIIDKAGNFMLLQQKTGAGIVSSSGRIKSYDYPLGDEIAAFLDWFQYKTEELISQWNCGTYGIVKEGQRR